MITGKLLLERLQTQHASTQALKTNTQEVTSRQKTTTEKPFTFDPPTAGLPIDSPTTLLYPGKFKAACNGLQKNAAGVGQRGQC